MYYFFITLFITFFSNGMDEKKLVTYDSSSGSISPRQNTFLNRPPRERSSSNLRGKSVPARLHKRSILRSDSPTPEYPTNREYRSKTDPEETDNRPTPNRKKKEVEKPDIFTASKPEEISPYLIVRNKMDVFNQVYCFLSNHHSNPNVLHHETGSSLFHHVVSQKQEHLIDLFLQHPGLDSLIQNNEGIVAHQYVPHTDKYKKLYKKLQLRAKLDEMIYELLVADKEFFTNRFLKSDCFQKIDALFSKISQETIPEYIDANFILAMIIFRLKHNMKAPQNTFQ